MKTNTNTQVLFALKQMLSLHVFAKQIIWLLRAMLLAMLLMLPQNSFAEEGIEVQDLTPFLQEGVRSYDSAINEIGQVVGYTHLSSGSWEAKAFVWDEVNGYHELTSPQGSQVVAMDINNLGQIVGTINSGSGQAPFIYVDGVMTILPTINEANARAIAINDLEQIVGETFSSHAVVWERNVDGIWEMIQLPALPTRTEPRTKVNDINNLGQLVGRSDSDLGARAVLWQKVSGTWQVTNLDSLGIGNSTALAINNLMQIVGYSKNIGSQHGFVWENGIMTDLGVLSTSSPYSQAKDINDYGLIVGHSNDSSNADRHTAVMWKKHEGIWQLIDIDPNNEVSGWGVSRAYHINNLGVITGETYISNYGGFVWAETLGLRFLPLLPSTYSATVNGSKRAMNEQGHLIGRSRVGTSYHASLWKIPLEELPLSEQIVNIQDKVRELVELGVLKEGQAVALNNSLNMTVQLLEDEKIKPAIALINAFINKVRALVNAGQISEEDGNVLTDAAQAAITDIENM